MRTLNEIPLINQILNKIYPDNLSILNYTFPNEMNYFLKDKDNFESKTFRWEEIEIPTILERSQFLLVFINRLKVKKNDGVLTHKILNTHSELYHAINVDALCNIFTLKCIDNYTNFPNYNFGQPIYNNSLTFYTNLLEFFILFHFEKDLKMLDKITAKSIETTDPISRTKIHQKNMANKTFRDKYFNEDFNIVDFCIKLVRKFIPGASWRWIGGLHRAHIHALNLCKKLFEYCLIDPSQKEKIKNELCLKAENLRSLENIIEADFQKKTISQEWFDIWVEGLQTCRG